VVGAMLPDFQKRIVRWQPICRISKPARLPLAGFQKLFGATLRRLSSKRSKTSVKIISTNVFLSVYYL
jgi:hypothetical protein